MVGKLKAQPSSAKSTYKNTKLTNYKTIAHGRLMAGSAEETKTGMERGDGMAF